jgi:hypothetical protein
LPTELAQASGPDKNKLLAALEQVFKVVARKAEAK